MTNVFISHRKSDDVVAERLASELRSRGYDVWLDVWDVGLGDSIIGKMNEGITKASYVVVCYSDTGVTSAWMGREWMSALAMQLGGHGIKLLPVILSGGGPPALLTDIQYADLTKDWDKGLNQLLNAMT